MTEKFVSVLKEAFDVDCIDIKEVHGGLSAMNYKVDALKKPFFLKVYDKKKVRTSIWTDNIDCYMPILVWLNENDDLRGRIANPLRTVDGKFRVDDHENVYLLFDFIEGEAVGKVFSRNQLMETAEILACLHETPVRECVREDFEVPFCDSLENFLPDGFHTLPDDLKEVIFPYLSRISKRNSELKTLSESMKRKKCKMVLCHTDAHGYNLMQGERLVLVDWEGMKLSPAEADLILFSKKEYWDVFIEYYRKRRPDFRLDDETFMFYVLRRKIEDIWAFIEGLLYDEQSVERRERDLNFLRDCLETLDEDCFSL